MALLSAFLGLAFLPFGLPMEQEERPELPASAPAPKAYAPEAGPHAVEVVESVLLPDPKRGKDLPLAVCFPKAEGKLPLIVFSHGAGGSGRNVLALPRLWASHGYIVLAPTHADSLSLGRRASAAESRPATESSPAEEEDVSRSRGIVDRLVGRAMRPEIWQDRARDVSFLLDSIEEIEKAISALKGKVDLDHVGVGGHSLGALTAQLAGGALLDLPGSGPTSLADSRVRAVLMLSGQGRGQMGLTEKSWEKMSLPMLSVTGSLDRGARGQDPAWRRDPFDLSPPGDKVHLFIEGAHHGSFTGRFAGERTGRAGLRGGRRLGAAGKEIFEWVEVATLAFWDAYLKGDPGAKAYLRTDDLELRSRGAATLVRR